MDRSDSHSLRSMLVIALMLLALRFVDASAPRLRLASRVLEG